MIFSKKNKILAIFCHPDDPELVCYGTLRKLKAYGAKVEILFLTKGERSSQSQKLDRVDFSVKALKKITKKIYFENLEDGNIAFDSNTITLIDRYITKIKPNTIITHFTNVDGSSSHQDHHNTRLVVSNSARRSKYVKHLILSEPEYNIKEFVPNFYVDISKYFKDKIKVLDFHKIENTKYYFQKDYLLTKSNWWSIQIDNFNKKENKFYEAFQIVFSKG